MTDEPKPETATEVEARTREMAAEEFAAVAMGADTLVKTVLAACLKGHPNGEDAIVSGAMTALVRFGVERQQLASPAAVITERDVFGYFARYVQSAAAILVRRPTKAH